MACITFILCPTHFSLTFRSCTLYDDSWRTARAPEVWPNYNTELSWVQFEEAARRETRKEKCNTGISFCQQIWAEMHFCWAKHQWALPSGHGEKWYGWRARMRTCTHTHIYSYTNFHCHFYIFVIKFIQKLHSLCVAHFRAADKLVGLYEHFRTPRKGLIPTASATHSVLLHHAAKQAEVRSPNAPLKRLQKETYYMGMVSHLWRWLCPKIIIINAQTTVYFSYGGCG